MPPLIVVVLLLAAPLYSLALLVFDTQTAPHPRTVRALGSGILLKTGILAAVVGLIEGQLIVWFPLFLIAYTAIRIMHGL